MFTITARRLALSAAIVALASSGGAGAKTVTYNVLVFNDFTGQYSDVEGALAAGGKIALDGYAVGAKLTSAADSANTLVAGKSISFSNGQLYHGNAVAPVITGNANVQNGTKVIGTAINFAKLPSLYTAYAGANAALASTGTVTNQYGTLTLTGALAGLNVFSVAGSTFGSINSFNLSIPTNGYALINVNGGSASLLNMGFNTGSTLASNILFNFAGATSLTLGGIGFTGSILAPKADVVFNNGHLDGQLIARSFTGNGQINNYAFNTSAFSGAPSPTGGVPEPATWALMLCGFAVTGAMLRRKGAALAAA